jgi:hypothetical protein
VLVGLAGCRASTEAVADDRDLRHGQPQRACAALERIAIAEHDDPTAQLAGCHRKGRGDDLWSDAGRIAKSDAHTRDAFHDVEPIALA